MGRADETDSGASEPTIVQPRQAPKSVYPGAVTLSADEAEIDRYEWRRQLGVGSMGEVDLCRDKHIGRDVARKVLLPNHQGDAVLRARFLRECRIQGQLEHPSIVPVYDLGVDEDGSTYFTMKVLRGLTLKQILKGLKEKDRDIVGKFSTRKLLTAFSAVCLTIDFAHSRGVLHRDLKPSNVMLGNFGEVYVLDWGIAKLKQEVAAASVTKSQTSLLDQEDTARRRPVDAFDDIQTAAGKILGTFGYMAPEQARGAIGELDARSDVYALGAILFEVLTLMPLHPKTSWKEMLFSTLKGVSARPSVRAPQLEIPPELEEICQRATALDPMDRYPSARELSEAVERYLDGDRDLELRRKMAQRHATQAEARAEVALEGGPDAEEARRGALREVGRTLALDPEDRGAMAVLGKLWRTPPKRMPAEVEAEMDLMERRRIRFQLDEGVRFDLTTLLILVPMTLWMGVSDGRVLGAAALFMMASAAMKHLARTSKDMLRGHYYGYGAYLLTVASLICWSRSFGPLFFAPVLLTFFTMAYTISPIARYRRVIMGTGALALVGSVLVEVLGVLPKTYVFGDGLSMTILAHAVRLHEVPTMTALTMGSLFMIVGPAVMMSRQKEAMLAAEQRSALQAWHLKHLLPDGAQAPVSHTSSSV